MHVYSCAVTTQLNTSQALITLVQQAMRFLSRGQALGCLLPYCLTAAESINGPSVYQGSAHQAPHRSYAQADWQAFHALYEEQQACQACCPQVLPGEVLVMEQSEIDISRLLRSRAALISCS